MTGNAFPLDGIRFLRIPTVGCEANVRGNEPIAANPARPVNNFLRLFQ
jgi:hypothetical protein